MKRRLGLWLAIFGMALNALWPLLANASPTAFAAPICSAVGTQAASVYSGGVPVQPVPAKFMGPHCPFCLGASDQTPTLAPDITIAIVALDLDTQPMATERSLPVTFLRLRPESCGPPRLS